MESQKGFETEEEKRHYEALVMSMHNGLVFAENGMLIAADRDAISYITCSLLLDGIEPRFKSGGYIFERATEDFLKSDRKRIKRLIRTVRRNRNPFHIKTDHRYSRRNNLDMV